MNRRAPHSRAAGAWAATLVLACASVAASDADYPRFEGLDRGRRVWLGTCMACHGEGFADAPAVGNRAAWTARVAKGRAQLYLHALEGFFGPASTMMPPRGGNPQLSDDDVRHAVDYMLRLAGH